MDTSILETMLHLDSMHVRGVDIYEDKKEIYVYLEWDDSTCKCPRCDGDAQFRKAEPRSEPVRHLDWFEYKTLLFFDAMEMQCVNCRALFNRKPSFMGDRGVFITEAMLLHMVRNAKGSAVSFVAECNDIPVSTFTELYYGCLQGADSRREYANVRRLGIDEISQLKGRGHYVLLLYDLDSHEVIEVLENRLKSTLLKFLREHQDGFLANLEAVCIDMWSPYKQAIETVFPHVRIVTDKYHVFKNYNDCLDECRRDVARKIRDPEKRKKFNRECRRILFSPLQNVMDEPDGEERLQAIFDHDPSCGLNRLYVLRESLREIYNSKSEEEAQAQLQNWIRRARYLESKYLSPFLTTVSRWKNEMLAFVVHPISNGVAEGFNNKIKLVKRLGYGFNNFVHFRLRILHTCCKSFARVCLQ